MRKNWLDCTWNSYSFRNGFAEKDSGKIYAVALNCDDFSILASANSDKSENALVQTAEAGHLPADAVRGLNP
jgi:hypothetical protein